MLIQSILFISTASNDNSSSDNNQICSKENGDCLCDICQNRYIEHLLKRNQEWENLKLELSKEYKAKKSNENCLRQLLRNFFDCFTGTADTPETTENPENAEREEDNAENTESNLDD